MLTGMGNLVPVTLVVGEEEFLVDRAVRAAVAQAREALAEDGGGGEGDLHDLEASALGQGELAALTSPSLFGGGAVVIVRNAQNAAKEIAAELTRYAAGPAPDAAVIVTHAGGAKGKALVTDLAKAGARQVDCPKLTRAGERTDFVRQEFRRVGRQADDDAVRALLDAIGGDLRELASAVDQLASDTDGTDQRGHRRQVLPRPGRGDRLQRRRPRGRGAAERGPRTAPLGPGHRHRPGPDHQRAGHRGTAARPGRRGPAEREPQRARRRGRRPAVEDRPGPPAAARLAPGRRGRALQAVAEADAQVKGGGVSPEYALERAIRQIVAYRNALR